ncbi:hypothetical protein BCEP4_170040 [Burkholderia cepacia]|nr:hypothetical protein BCEP4_170040 [Burkholderia cepacia]
MAATCLMPRNAWSYRQPATLALQPEEAVLTAVLRCRPVVRRSMHAREQTPASGGQGR